LRHHLTLLAAEIRGFQHPATRLYSTLPVAVASTGK
jgi:hypothetical protein